MPARFYEPIFVPSRASSYATTHDYGIDDSINRADYLSNAVLEDTYEAATRSRGKDHALLRNLNAAIVSTELHVNPRVAAVSRRVRASTLPPAPRPPPGLHFQQPQAPQYIQVAESQLARASPPRPVVVMLAPSISSGSGSGNSSSRYRRGSSTYSSKPVVLSQAEVPWYARARASSVPPPAYSRSVRAASVPPQPVIVQQFYATPEALSTSQLWAHRPVPLRSNVLRSARARSVEPTVRPGFYGEPVHPLLIPTSHLWAHRPRVLRKDASRLARARALDAQSNPGRFYRSASVPRFFDRPSDYYNTLPGVQERAFNTYLYAHRGRFGPESRPVRPYIGNFPQVYVPWKGIGPSNRSKAAIIGSRLDAAGYTGGKTQTRRPRSEFAANKLREFKRDEIEEGVYYRTPATSALYASRPPLPKPTERKAIRDIDGFTKPKNLLSWQYRLESRLAPSDLIYESSRFGRMREQVKDVQEKMDRHRQLLSRYVDNDFKIASNPSQNVGSSSVKIPAYYAAGGDPSSRPMSDLRRRLRRTIAKAKNNPDYYRE